MGLPAALVPVFWLNQRKSRSAPTPEFEELEASAGGSLLELRVILRAHRVADVALALEEQGRLAPRTAAAR